LILFDLPLNPDLLEQRIGRLDRIGQTDTIKLHVPYFAGTAQEKLLNWYDQGLNAFKHVCSVGHGVFEVFENEIRRELIANNAGADDKFADLVTRTKALVDETLTQMQQGRDRLLELNSCHKDHADEVVEEVDALANVPQLTGYMDAVFDEYGVDQQIHGEESFILKPTDHMMSANFPALPEDGLTATYDRETALSREDMHFLTWEHPMVTGAMDMILTSDFGNATFCSMEFNSKDFSAGTLILEAIYSIHCPATRFLQIHRYLPESSVRIVIDNNNRNLTKALTHAVMNKYADRVNKRTTEDLIRHARPAIQSLIDQSTKLAMPKQNDIIQQAQEVLSAEAKDDIERLRALSEVNPNIRKEELVQLEGNAIALAGYLKQARLKLDAIRVVFVSG
jgi:ATP-dependent helicase HepA